MYCGKCRKPVDEDGRGSDGYFTCGYGGSHRAQPERPGGTARINPRANRRKRAPSKPGKTRQVIRQQQLEDAREMGRAEREIRSSDALRRHLATWRRASAIDSRESQPGVNQRLFGITDGK